MAGETRLALDFEPGDFSRFSGVEQGSAAQSVIQGAIVRAGFGTKACKFSNIPGVYWFGNGSMRSLAARYDSHETVNQEYWYSGSIRIPSVNGLSGYSSLLWELHHPASLYNLKNLGVAPHAIYFDGTNLRGRLQTGLGTVGSGYAHISSPIILATPPTNQWIDIIIAIKFTEANDGYVKWYIDPTGTATFGAPVQETGIPTMPFTSSIHNVLLYNEQGIYNNSGTNATQSTTSSYYSMGWRRVLSFVLAVAEFGAGGGGGSSQPPPPGDPPLPPPGVPGDGPPVDAGGSPTTHALAAAPESSIRFQCGPSWRFVVTDLAGEVTTVLDHLASDRVVTPKLNEPLEVSCTVPSDNPEINITWAPPGGNGDGFPFVAEGVRQLYCFRRESVLPPYFVCRAATLILQTTDAGGSDPARTTISAWDPWQYMMSRPVLVSAQTPVDYGGPGAPLQQGGITYPPFMPANEIALDMISNTIVFGNAAAPAAAKACFVDLAGTVADPAINETCQSFAIPGYNIPQGKSLGQALQDLCAQGFMDIVLRPIFDPVNRPGILAVVDIYNQYPPAGGAGDYRYGAVFAWDKPSRSLVGITDVIDGTLRANDIQYFYEMGGNTIAADAIDLDSIRTFGEYKVQQFFPQQALEPGVNYLAFEELNLRSTFKQTVTLDPAPERAPQPFVDYAVGDRVPVYASNRLRQSIPPPGPIFGQLPLVPTAWVRVFGIPIDIDDNGVETVRELILGPVGAPPPQEVPGTSGSALVGNTGASVAVGAAVNARTGARGALGPRGSRP